MSNLIYDNLFISTLFVACFCLKKFQHSRCHFNKLLKQLPCEFTIMTRNSFYISNNFISTVVIIYCY